MVQILIKFLILTFIIFLSFAIGVFLERKKLVQKMLYFFKQIKYIVKIVKEETLQQNEENIIHNQQYLKENLNNQSQSKTLSIGITTFPARYESLFNQIKQIREIDNKIDILLTVNSFYDQILIKKYSDNILNLCKQFNISPIFFPQFSGLARMWNTLIRHSSSTHILILNDDLEISNSAFISEIHRNIETKDMFTINNSFGHFVISKREAIKMNFFSEIFIAFGEEDGDFVWRYCEKYKHKPESVRINGIINKTLNSISYDHTIDTYKDQYGGNKPKISSQITKHLYIANKLGIKGMYDQPYLRKFDDPIQYPYEHFVLNNWDNIGDFRNIIL